MEETKEIWKPIAGFEGYYEVSNIGRVRSLRRTLTRAGGRTFTIQEKIVYPSKQGRGYKMVNLSKNNKKKQCLVHRLVAAAFIPNPYNLPQINHKDEDKTNNRVENLEWCTSEYNNKYGTRNERITKTFGKPVLQFTLDGRFVRSYASISEAERQIGKRHIPITKCCQGIYQQVGGYKWRYAK